MNIFTIPPGIPFLDALATWWLARADDPIQMADGLFLMPTRRAARGLAEAFLRAAEGRPLLLPRISAIGALDEAPLAMAGALEMPPAVGEAERLAALTRLVMALNGKHGAPATADRAWLLAAELARLLDEAHRQGIDLAATLPGLVGADYAIHWADTLKFLQIVTAHWPQCLQAAGKIDAADRGIRLLEYQAATWAKHPPGYPVVLAGTSGGIRAVATLMRIVACMEGGHVVLPGVDQELGQPEWDALEDSHPQAGLRDLLNDMGATRGDLKPWPPTGEAELPAGEAELPAGEAELRTGEAEPRVAAVWRALLPASALNLWRKPFIPHVDGLERLAAADQQEEAVAIALVLRHALETPGARAALVTPDRALAARVAAELGRFGVVVDDSAGEPLGETPPGVFLRLLARAVAEGLAPVALLGILKHPLAALGLAPQHCRTLARRLEMRILRGPAPPHGIAGLRAVLQERQDPELEAFVDRIEARLAPLLQIATATRALPAAALPVTALLALIQAAEAVAATEATSGASRLWALEEGEALAEHLTSLVAAFPILPEQPARILPGLLDVSLQGVVVRSRRALRGRGDTGEHPRVSILGLLEARLLSFDVLVLGSLAEAVWPPAADPGPWMSRPMRKAAGLASPEAAIGQMAHDFAMLCSAAPRVVLSCPLRRDGAPTVPARWLVRLEAMLSGYDAALEHNPATTWARALDQPNGPARAVRPPRPCPPLQARPRTLSVTEVETWLRDPYGIYARHVLGLRAMAPLEQAVENSDFGTVVHGAIASWVRALGLTFPPDAALLLRNEMVRALEARALRPALVAWWRPRLMRIADWVAEQEGARRIARPGVVVAVEVSGRWQVPGVPTPFELRGRADRIERRADGRLAILDYKTGVVPKGKEVEAGHAPQLPLEAAMAASGSFGPNMTGVAAELTYWRLTGGYVPGQIHEVFKGDPAATAAGVDTAATELARLVVKFDEPSQAYLSQPHPGAAPRFTDYAQVARVAEWSAVEDE